MGKMGRKRQRDQLIRYFISLFSSMKTGNAVGEIMQKPGTTIHYAIKKYKSDGKVKNKPRSDHLKKQWLTKDYCARI